MRGAGISIAMKCKFFLFAAMLAAMFLDHAPSAAQNGGWVQLFDGRTLDGWKQLNGEAEYRIEDDEIVGAARLNTPNSFLCTERDYGNFVLEYEFLVDPRLNSGVQIRSLSRSDYRDGRVHGYQVEIDPSSRAWSAGIYDEARRGWLYPLSRNPEGGAAFRQNDWNTVRVEAVGPSIRTWLNGQMTANLVDDMTASGMICLQVHSIRDPGVEGAQVRWRNLRIKTSSLEEERMPVDPDVPEFNYLENELTERERRRGWRLLWDGETTRGWRGAGLNHFPETGWETQDGALTVTGGGDIVTEETFGDFELEVDFKISEGANSGIKYYVKSVPNGGPVGLEYQIIDDEGHENLGENHAIASLYDLIPAENLSIPSRDIPVNGAGEWNRARIISRNGLVEHWLNDHKVVEYDRGTQAFRALVQKSKYADFPEFGEWEQGRILLQDHGDRVSFRNIKIREF